MSAKPLIGIMLDNKDDSFSSNKYLTAMTYSQRVSEAGGLPVHLSQNVSLVEDYAHACDGFIFTGGNDPDTRPFGEPLHPKARLIAPERQAFELALLDTLAHAHAQKPVLGVCLGMQMMALHAGGKLEQYLPDVMANAASHANDQLHQVDMVASCPWVESMLCDEPKVCSYHRQAVADSGKMRVVAKSPDGVIEAIDDPTRKYYIGLQWHPERVIISQRFWHAFVAACQPIARAT
ncbi:MAG: gamma-glutamyl-gamma-aminobutyrate hydrolase family protein [Phycisphaeraceae bacterium]|nr:gamma-glutamyl-gamma-aminobutyrate hydrolase family protein [Phycisphaeraceae bacterium]